MLVFFHVPVLVRTLLIVLIALLTLAGIMVRPFQWNEALIALGGAFLLFVSGLILPRDVLSTLFQQWNTFLFFLGMMSLSALAEEAGLFDWFAAQAAYLARERAAWLYLNVFLLGSLISMILSNDATALILTPVVYILVTQLDLPVLPFLFACTFIADTASFLLPVSNPINIILLSKFPLDLFTYLKILFLPALVVIAINISVFFLLYRRQLHGRFTITRLPPPDKAIRHRAYFRYTCIVLVLVALAYVIASATQLPLSLVAMSGALLLLFGARFWKCITFRQIGQRLSWSIFGFIAGMFVVVQAVAQTGLTAQFGHQLLALAGQSSLGAVLVGTTGAAIGTNLINNVPMAVVFTSALQTAQHAPLVSRQGFLAASIFGCDLGPNITTVGSLATVLWLLILRQRGIEVSGLAYFKIGLLVTPLMLLFGALTIWFFLGH